jgi:hypothetical protein
MFVMSTALLYPTPGWAWGGEGHRIIALVAERILRLSIRRLKRE